ncbi:hypothetical protein U879_02045 [Defluviimonas sp. 20V17]|uniref:Chaperone of endosialidase n=1 Tax=Allgaiera indica TaxID=765699 RepID=A0AAN4UU64_9RHOB|nr:tail fiber domain-containing protein [Allgaiera indica]KDB05353.1 hypothetical protein U879_02045 [Defluviimonas sp. 20V17]GHE04798.1 hypothetical protein GCM10008024_33210 [Allgaiera indica]SDX54149.1 Chaperone of endosialidase [Allgaiera indica]
MTKITMKRGDTFAVYCQRLDPDGNPKPLTGVAINSTISVLTFSDTLTATVTDAANGKFTLSATPAATAIWPVTGSQQMLFDVQFDDGTYVVSTDSIQVVVQQSQTQVASTSTGLPGQSGNPLIFQDMPNAAGNIAAGANVQSGNALYKFAAAYMGALVADPATRPDGSALQTGDIYWNTALNEQRTWNGTTWQVVYTPSPTTTGDINYTGTLTGGTGVINIGAGQVYKDASGNIGIGTTSPSQALEIAGNMQLQNGQYLYGRNFAGSAVRLVGINASDVAYIGPIDAGTTTTIISASSSNTTTAFYTSGAERMRITSAGRVGIGTASPTSRLQLGDGTVSADNVITLGKTVTAAEGGLPTIKQISLTIAGTVNDIEIAGNGSGGGVVLSGRTIVLRSNAANGNVERLRVDSAGNLGLGVVPSAWDSGTGCLEIAPGYGFAAGSAQGLNVTYGTYYSATGWLYAVASPVTRYNQISGSHRWYIAPTGTVGAAVSFTQAMTLDGSGNLLVGATSTTGMNTGTSVNTGFALAPQGTLLAQRNDDSCVYLSKATGYTSGSFQQFYVNGAVVGGISTDGTTTTFATTSDARAKSDIIDATQPGKLIDMIRVRQFRMKADNSYHRFGFIAQELRQIVPEAVTRPAAAHEMLGVDYSKIVPILTKEIQSLRKRVAALEPA